MFSWCFKTGLVAVLVVLNYGCSEGPSLAKDAREELVTPEPGEEPRSIPIRCPDIQQHYRENFKSSPHRVHSPQSIAARYVFEKEFTGGKGGAKIYLVKDQKDNQRKVIKIFPRENFSAELSSSESGRELFITCMVERFSWFPKFYDYGLTSSKNPFVNETKASNAQYLFMVVEFVDGKSLIELAKNKEAAFADVAKVKAFMFQIISGLEKAFLALGFIHFDLHPNNIIVTEKEPHLVKIIDFGLSSVREFHVIDGIDFDKILRGEMVANRSFSAAIVNFGQHMSNNADSIFNKSAYATKFVAHAEVIRQRHQSADDVQFINMMIYVFRNFYSATYGARKQSFGEYCSALNDCKRQFSPNAPH